LIISRNEKEVINKLLLFEKDAASLSEEDIFRELGKLDLLFCRDKFYKININGIIANIGTRIKSLKLLLFTKDRLEIQYKDNPSNKLLYDLGNSYFSIADINCGHPPKIECLLDNKDYRTARRYFYETEEKAFSPQAYTNLGNILEKYERNYESIIFYNKALKENHDFGMASGNKGIALTYYYNLLKKNPDILFEARDLIAKSLLPSDTLNIGGQAALDSFKIYLTSLDNFLSKRKRTEESLKLYPTAYQSFCSNKLLFLNLCFDCHKCDDGYKDNIFPRFVDNIKNISNEDTLKYHSFSKKMYFSIKTLNQIIEDYATARHIYFISQKSKFTNVDEQTEYYSVLDYCRNSIYFGYIKTAYIKLFNILDKIARLAFYNYGLGQKAIYIDDLLNPLFKNIILKNNNRGLLALNDLAWDFTQNGIYYHLKIIRNYLTHEFLDIKIDMFINSDKNEELFENHHLSETLLTDYLNELFQIVKAALLYFVQAINKDYSDLTHDGDNKILPLPVLKQKEIFKSNKI